MMAEADEVDLSETPITALRVPTQSKIEFLLNERRVLPTDDDLPRDWEGFVHLANLDNLVSAQSSNCTGDALRLWQEQALKNQQAIPSLKDLQDIFCQLDRWDIFYDTEEMLKSDAKFHKERLMLVPVSPDVCEPLLHGCLTEDDVQHFREGRELLDYDGFLLYADKDQKFALTMKNELEIKYKLKIVVKEDLISSGFEVQALTNLITRCATLIVIVSPNLFEEPANNYLIGFATAYSIEQRNSRIIPCLYEPCVLPKENNALKYLVHHDYTKLTGLKIDFFKKVFNSVDAACKVRGRPLPLPPIKNHPDIQRCTIREIKDDVEVANSSQAHVSMDTAIVYMSDPSTHFPGNSLENTKDDKWSDHSSSLSNTESSIELLKEDSKSSFLSKNKKWFKGKKWLKKKKAVALLS